MKSGGDERGFAAFLISRKMGAPVAAWLKPSPDTGRRTKAESRPWKALSDPGNTLNHAQKHAPKPFLTHLWEILCESSFSNGQFRGSTHLAKGQFQGFCREESQPNERTFARRAAPLKRTFGRVKAPFKPTLNLILLDLTNHPHREHKNADILTTFRARSSHRADAEVEDLCVVTAGIESNAGDHFTP